MDEAKNALDRIVAENVQAALELYQMGNLVSAEAVLQEVLQVKPYHPDALHWLGVIAHDAGMLDVAVELISHAIAVEADAKKYHNLGVVYKKQGLTNHSINCLLMALTLSPDYASAHQNLGAALVDIGHPQEAAHHFRLAAANKPKTAEMHYVLGVTFQMIGLTKEAEDCYQKALVLDPQHANANNNLGMLKRVHGNAMAAESYYRLALTLNPDNPEANNNLAGLFLEQGRIDEAIDYFRRALAVKPDFMIANTNMLFCMLYSQSLSPDDLMKELRFFRERFETPLIKQRRPHSNDRTPSRRLRVGYVSADFCNHAAAFFFEPVFAAHDGAQVETFLYYSNRVNDAVTARFKARADHFIEAGRMTDEALAERIRADQIDILVDLSGHTNGHRQMVFARKPAPVQATWIGMLGSTGLEAMDYRITDPYLDPPGLTETYHTEKLIRLPLAAPFLPSPHSPPVSPLPCLAGAPFTFGCLNNLGKVNDDVLRVWARILAAVPNSRLLLGNVSDDNIRSQVIGRCLAVGIAAERLVLRPKVSMEEFLKLHHEIDLALDPFPYAGGTTSCHARWMGVPVITLAGRTTISRTGVSAMAGIGLDEFVANSENEYVEHAVACATEPARLAEIRRSLRTRLESSLANNPAELCRHLEAAYRDMWSIWCRAEAPSDAAITNAA